MIEPPWIDEARKHVGVREIKGPEHEWRIVRWWKAIRRGGIKDDETPWCAAFVGGCLEACGVISTRYESAKSYLSWGRKLTKPLYGCVVIFDRDGGGHVGFVVGKDSLGRLMVLGGNQGDEVNVRAFTSDRVLGYRWPMLAPLPEDITLPTLTAAATTGEA